MTGSGVPAASVLWSPPPPIVGLIDIIDEKRAVASRATTSIKTN